MTKERYESTVIHQDRRPKNVRVRCLGFGAEHFFISADPARQRICCRCRARLASANYGRAVVSHRG